MNRDVALFLYAKWLSSSGYAFENFDNLSSKFSCTKADLMRMQKDLSPFSSINTMEFEFDTTAALRVETMYRPWIAKSTIKDETKRRKIVDYLRKQPQLHARIQQIAKDLSMSENDVARISYVLEQKGLVQSGGTLGLLQLI